MNEEIKPEEIEQLLKHIDSDDYDTWVHVGMALKKYGEDNNTDCFNYYDDWSRTSSKYDSNDCQKTWNSFKNDKSNNLTIGTVIDLARKGGYMLPGEKAKKLYDEQGIVTLPDGTQKKLEAMTPEDYERITIPKKNQTPDTETPEEKHKKVLQLIKDSNTKNSLDSFIENINKHKIIYSSGFKSLDKALCGGFTGGDCYLFGGETGTGKTGFILQASEMSARTGIPVVYISLELSKNEIIARSLARITFINEVCNDDINKFNIDNISKDINGKRVYKYSLTEHEVQFFERYKTDENSIMLDTAIEQYKTSIASNFYVLEAEATATVDDIADYINVFIESKKQKPIVFIDYMQLIKPSRRFNNYTEKQHIDYNVSILKQLARIHEIPIIMISSINRASYGTETNNSAFKGSGDLEYTASCTMLMNYRYYESAKYNCKTKQKAEEMQRAIRKDNYSNSRNGDAVTLELKIPKSRHSLKDTVINFDFYGRFGFFVDKGIQSIDEAEQFFAEYDSRKKDLEIDDEPIY